ncbi:MAG: hypothetical protein ACTSVI_03470 [Promethearchaeota archaeon]
MNHQVIFDVYIPLGIFLSILGTVFLNVGKGVQRLGAETLGKEMLKKWKTDPKEKKKIIIWIIGSLMTAVSSVFSFAAAFFLDRPSTAVALSGIGILSVVLFAAYVIKEHITPAQLTGIIIIVVGTALLGIDYPEIEKSLPNDAFYMFSLALMITGILMAFISIKKGKAQGLVFGIIAGFFNGFAAIASLFATSTGQNELVNSLINIWMLIGILLGQGAFWSTQYAFKKGGKASIVVPAMNSFIILIPFISDAWIYHIPFSIFQILSFILNLIGIIILCLSSSKELNQVMTDKIKKEETTP